MSKYIYCGTENKAKTLFNALKDAMEKSIGSEPIHVIDPLSTISVNDNFPIVTDTRNRAQRRKDKRNKKRISS